MTLALMGWSNVWAEDPDWYLYYYVSDSEKGDFGQFKETATPNVFLLENVEITKNVYFNVHNNSWNTQYGWDSEGVTATWTPVTLATASGVTGWLAVHNGTYSVLLDMTGEKPTIEFDPVLVIDEDATTAPSITADYYYTTLKRTLTADKWQTICLPVWLNMTGENYLVSTYFGAGTEVAEFNSADGNVLNFTTVTSNMGYNTPYLIKPTTNITSVYLGKIWVTSGDLETTKVTAGNYEFIGTNAQKKLEVGTYYVADGNIHLVITENKTNIKATRAYFRAKDSGLAREMRFVIDGVVTSIDQIEITEEENITGEVYNLNGQRMDKPFESLPAGVYIINGKKIIKK